MIGDKTKLFLDMQIRQRKIKMCGSDESSSQRKL